MKDSTKDIVYLSTFIVIFFAFFALLYHLDANQRANSTESQKEQQSLCLGKENRARPACWREADWKAYCERVECKVGAVE